MGSRCGGWEGCGWIIGQFTVRKTCLVQPTAEERPVCCCSIGPFLPGTLLTSTDTYLSFVIPPRKKKRKKKPGIQFRSSSHLLYPFDPFALQQRVGFYLQFSHWPSLEPFSLQLIFGRETPTPSTPFSLSLTHPAILRPSNCGREVRRVLNTEGTAAHAHSLWSCAQDYCGNRTCWHRASTLLFLPWQAVVCCVHCTWCMIISPAFGDSKLELRKSVLRSLHHLLNPCFIAFYRLPLPFLFFFFLLLFLFSFLLFFLLPLHFSFSFPTFTHHSPPFRLLHEGVFDIQHGLLSSPVPFAHTVMVSLRNGILQILDMKRRLTSLVSPALLPPSPYHPTTHAPMQHLVIMKSQPRRTTTLMPPLSGEHRIGRKAETPALGHMGGA